MVDPSKEIFDKPILIDPDHPKHGVLPLGQEARNVHMIVDRKGFCKDRKE